MGIKSKHILCSLLFFLAIHCSVWAQDKYKSHTVQPGETVETIAERYKLHKNSIYRLNPGAKKGISENDILILPANSAQVASNAIEFIKHKVRRKETLYSISQRYNVSEDDLKRYNKHLYANQVKKGEKLLIPVGLYAPGKEKEEVAETPVENDTLGVHVIQPKETKYGVARKYGITLEQLQELNPTLEANFPIGTELVVPKKVQIEDTDLAEDIYQFYEVQPKEGFFRLKVKLGLTKEEIVALNPYAADGLKVGMIIKVPKESLETDLATLPVVDLSTAPKVKTSVNLAVLLPFRLQRVELDSVAVNKTLLQDDATLRVALDFYSGALMAATFAQEKGLDVTLDVFDTEASESKVGVLVGNTKLQSADAIVGPLLRKNVEKVAFAMDAYNVPVFSPLSRRDIKGGANFFQTLPSVKAQEKKMLQFLKDSAITKKILLVSEPSKQSQVDVLKQHFPTAVSLVVNEEGFFKAEDIDGKLVENEENWVILLSDNPILVSNVVGLLNAMPEEKPVRLLTLDKNAAFEYSDVSNLHLAKLKFTYPSVARSYSIETPNAFLVSYKNKYGVYPNRYAVRGFDVTYDVLMRLATQESIYDMSEPAFETQYIEGKFRYVKQGYKGYENNAIYIIKYKNDLQLEVLR